MSLRRLLLLVLVWTVACTPARKKVRGDIVRRVKFTGNGSGYNDYQLRNAMEQHATAFGLMLFPVNFMVDPKLLSRHALLQDPYRLEVFYAHHGYFDARFTGWSIRRVRRRTESRAGIVDLFGAVDPGPVSLVRAYDIAGQTGATRGIARNLLRTGYLRPKRPFDLSIAELDRYELERDLQRRGFAYAEVELHTDAFPDERAVDVELEMRPGILADNGPVTISGNRDVATKFIEQNLRIEQGAPYRLDDLVAMQNRLFGMGVFATVRVEPDLSDPTRKEVPIHVNVTESKFRVFRVGFGLQLQGNGTVEPNIFARFKHVHVAKQLIGFDLYGRVGAITTLGESDFEPTWETRAALIYPRIFGQKVAQQLDVKVERGVQQGLFRFFNPEADFRSIYKPSDVLVMSLGPHVEFFDYIDIEENGGALALARRIFGRNPYQLTSLDYNFTLDWRDDPLNTRRGSFFTSTLRYAFPLRDGDFTFLSFSGDWRLFRPIRTKRDVPFAFATRIHGKTLWSLSADKALPYPELFFAGGPSSMRGFPQRAMGPFAIETDGDRRFYIPRGGSFGLVFSEEFRYYASASTTWALFLDAGTLASPHLSGPDRDLDGDGVEDPFLDQLLLGFRWAGGVGWRYNSPVGPARLDLAIRPRYPEDFQEYGVPAECSRTDKRRRIDLVHALFNRCSTAPAVQLSIAIGEAI